MLHPQFIKQYLFKNMKLFKIFLKYWNSMSEIDSNANFDGMLMKQLGYKGINVDNIWYLKIFSGFKKYLADKYIDITYCFYSMMEYLRRKHLKQKYLGRYIGIIESKIGNKNISDNDKYQCILNLIWKKLALKYKEYNINMEQMVSMKLILLPTNFNCKFNNGLDIDYKIRKKIIRRIKCGNYGKCKKTMSKMRIHEKMKLCSQCKMTYYCCRKCQKYHWKHVHSFCCVKLI
eukprot:322935_1